MQWKNRGVERFLAGAAQCRQVQQNILLEKIRRSADSDFGRKHGLNAIRSVADFRRQIPLTTYEYYRPYIERVKAGDFGAMFNAENRILMFAMTSGSTDSPKYIPVTSAFLKEYRVSWNIWGVRTYRDHSDLIQKKTLQLSSDWQQYFTPGGTACGGISGLAAEQAPRISRPIFLLPKALMKIHDHTAKQYTALRIGLASRDIGIIITANPSTLIEFARLADAQRETLIRDIHDGTLSSTANVDATVREAIRRPVCRRDPRRARELEQIIRRTGALLPRDYWPRLSTLAVWTGGSVGAYLPRVRELYGDTAFRDHGLSASEGRMTTPFEDGTSAGLLDYTSHYFEFIPEAEHGKDNPIVLEGHELETDRNYFIVLSTSSGLFRYQIHDLVRCVGFHGTTPQLEFLNKGSYYSSVSGEKLSEFQVVSAVKQAFAELTLPFEEFTLAPVWGDPPGYVLLVEPSARLGSEQALTRRVDELLSTMNCEYANRIETHRLRPIVVQRVPAGTWSRIKAEKRARSGNPEQYKHPYLANDVHLVEQLLKTGAAVSVPSLERVNSE